MVGSLWGFFFFFFLFLLSFFVLSVFASFCILHVSSGGAFIFYKISIRKEIPLIDGIFHFIALFEIIK
jgi:hypothetical protein